MIGYLSGKTGLNHNPAKAFLTEGGFDLV